MIFRAVEDTDLISRVRRGDIEAFNLLVSRWEKRVFNYLLRLTGSPDDALDLSQDSFLNPLSLESREPGGKRGFDVTNKIFPDLVVGTDWIVHGSLVFR